MSAIRWVLGLFGLLCLMALSGCGLAPGEYAFELALSPENQRHNTPEEAFEAYKSGTFMKATSRGFGRGYNKVPVWAVVTLKRPGTALPLYLTVGPSVIDHVSAYQLMPDNKLVFLGQGGMQVSVDERRINTLDTSFVLRPQTQDPLQVLIRTDATSASAAYFRLHDELGFQRHLRWTGLGFGTLLGVLLACLVLSVYILWFVRTPALGLWLIHILCGLMFVVAYNGFLLAWFPSAPARVQDTLLAFGGGPLLLTSVVFFERFFDLRRWHPRLYRLAYWLCWSAIPLSYLLPLVGWSPFRGLGLTVAPALALLAAAFIIQTWRGNAKVRRWGGWAWLLAACIGVMYLGRWGWMPFGPLSMVAWEAALVACYIALLVHQVRQLTRAQQQAQARLDRLQGRLMGERSSLQSRVEASTAQLQATNADLLREEQGQRELLQLAAQSFHPPTRLIREVLDQIPQGSNTVPDGVQDRLANMRAAAERMQFLANRLISSDRISSGLPMQPVLDWVSLDHCLRDVIRDTAPGIQVAVTPQAESAQVRGDPVMLRIALQNLVDNALRHGGGQPATVRVTMERVDDRLEVVVSDQGEGIEDAMKAQIFQRYTTRQAQPGHGLGLAIVAAIAEAHGAKLWVSDAHPRGAKFHLQFPIAAAN